MGCCFSANKKTPHQPDALHLRHFRTKPSPLPDSDKAHVDSRAPPPLLEEETVKEVVLSETPISKPQILKENTTQMPVIQEDLVEAETKYYVNKHEEEISQVSQVSDIYSISESFSTATTATTTTTTTTAITEKREDEAISKPTTREVSHRSPAKAPRKRPYTGEISRGTKSPAKRSEASHVGPRRTMPRNVGPNAVKKETGEGPSGRRSRSPATRTVSGVGRSPGRVTAGRPGGLTRVENTGQKEIKLDDGVLLQQQQQKSEYNVDESVDNPHVSLECFIFL
ncbi:hypothetical protein ACOSP7_002439 [Xanthoceras sorbifolium]